MTTESTETKKNLLPEKQQDVAKILNNNVLAVIGNDNLIGFEKAYQIANATLELKKLLTPEYMKPIMALQGNRLGFKTDKDDKGGYREEEVKNCLIEAVLTGVQPHSNQFNIIAGNMYVTKEGFGHLLSNIKGLKYKMIPSLPRINAEKSSAAVLMKIKWSMNGVEKEDELDIPVRMNQYMGTDAVLGKATRKARAWLFNTISGTEVADGDAVDTTHEVIASKLEKHEAKGEAVAAGVKGLMGKKEEKTEETKVDKSGQTSIV
jgi:hypothetical protein